MSVNIRKRPALLGVIALALVVAGLWWMFGIRDSGMSSGTNTPPRPPEAPPLSIIEHVAYRKTSEFDPGTIRVYLRNTTGRDMRFEKVLLDGLPIPVWGVDLTIENTAPNSDKEPESKSGDNANEHTSIYESAAARFSGKRILWAKLSPASIPPGGIGEFSAKLVNPLPRPMKVEFVPRSGDTLSAVVRPVDPAIRITAITFAEDLKRVYIYMEGVLDHPLELLGFELNGEWIGMKPPEHDKADTPALWLSSPNLAQGEKQLAILDLPLPLTQGDYITIRAVCRDGFAAEERVRVFAHFPIAAEYGRGNPDLGMDEGCYVDRPGWMGAADPAKSAPSSPLPPVLRVNLLFECHMHKYGGDKERCGLETLRRHLISEQFDPHTPTVNHPCRIRIETGCALFAETGDILRMNPAVTTGLSTGQKTDPPEEVAARLTRYAVLAARPRPLQVLADTSRFGSDRDPATPEEFRRRTFATLGSGAKGLLYRDHTSGKPLALGLRDEIRRVNAEVAHLRPYLAVADTVDWIEPTGRDDVAIYSLLAGRDALVIILVWHDKDTSTDQPTKAAAIKTENDRTSNTEQTDQSGGASIRLRLRLPEWFAPGKVQAIAVTGIVESGISIAEGYDLVIPLPETTSSWIIRGDAK